MEIPTLQRILVPVDFSESSLNALTTAVAISQRQGAELQLLHVLDADTHAFSGGEPASDALTELVQAQTKKIEELASRTADEHQITCYGGCRVGSVSSEIATAAHIADADLIVLGTHGTSGIRAFHIGTEAYQVIKTAGCPVLTVPAHKSWPLFEHILFPIRPVPNALEKYEFARKIIHPDHTQLTVLALHAPDEVISIGQLQDEVGALNVQLARDGIKSQTIFCPTELIAETVLQKADELAADLLVITATLDTRIQDFFIGPFTQQIVHNARVPVLSIRPHSSSAQGPSRVEWHYSWQAQAANWKSSEATPPDWPTGQSNQ
ncbi:universal stress protein [Spirosoma taeanense]|uniref:Universal stress protein n=1 Tax=Spirosoma taeanense TaxID=2735870 RepID=A0A6M5YBB9_9BACT|nr:universal stress protein [Spirosoma taeanense]QJW91239.1 universal stress protein [Spirosoma taeanense]